MIPTPAAFSWPATLLSSGNRALVAEAEELTAQLSSKRQACEESSDVVALLKENTTQARTMISTMEAELADESRSAERQSSEAKIMKGECDKMAKELRQWETEAERLQRLSRECESALAATHRNLEVGLSMAAYLEEAAKEALSHRIAREATSDALGAEVAKQSFTTLTMLSQANAVVARQRLELRASREEQQHVLRELDAVRAALRAAVRDQRSTVEELALVQAESAAADQAILTNSEAMQALKEQTAMRLNRRARLSTALATLQTDVKIAQKASEAKRAAYDKALLQVRESFEGLRQQARLIEAVRRQQRAEGQHGHSLVNALANHHVVSGEKRASVAQQRQYAAQLQELLNAIAKETLTHPTPSPESLYATYNTLQQRLAHCEDRLERTHKRVMEAVQGMIDEGRRGEKIQGQLSLTQHELAQQTAEQMTKAAVLQTVAKNVQTLTDDLTARQGLLPELQAVSLAQADQRRREHEVTIARLRDRLTEVTGGYQRLLQANTSLRASLRRTREELQQQQNTYSEQARSGVLLLSEVPQLEKELKDLEGRSQELAVGYSRAQAAFEAMRAAVDGQVNALREGAGAEERLRAQVAAASTHLEADVQTALVELHLQQAAAREHGEELRRLARRRDLLRSRYGELMQSLSRTVRAPLMLEAEEKERAGGQLGGQRSSLLPTPSSSSVVPSLGALAEDAAPEALHARLLLQRSYARERLMEKGNYLDLRLVSLERETNALRNMLDALKKERSKRAFGHSPAEARVLAYANPTATGALTSDTIEMGTPGDAAAMVGERAQLMQTELSLQEAALGAMHEQCELSRGQLKTMRKALHDLQAIEKQKRVQLQRLTDKLRKERQRRVDQGDRQLQKARASPACR